MIVTDECGQLIWWDYMRREVVCMDTGEVIGRICDYDPIIKRTEIIKRKRVEECKRLRRYGY